ncbi:MAG: GatB/YqeY domain-containing protein [Anaerolineae bacterium]
MDVDQRLSADLKDAMRRGDVLRREMLRMMRSALHYEEVAKQAPLDEQTAVQVLQREVSKREEALILYRKGNRQDLVDKAEAEIAVVREYLPQRLSDAEVESLVREAIAETGATNVKQLGQVMKALMPRTQGRADGKVVSDTVRRLLGGNG